MVKGKPLNTNPSWLKDGTISGGKFQKERNSPWILGCGLIGSHIVDAWHCWYFIWELVGIL
jgi:hypothetical protein